MAEIEKRRGMYSRPGPHLSAKDAAAHAFAERDRLKALNAELMEALCELESWGRVFVEKSPISAETLWRAFPQALDKARAALAKARE